MSPATLMDDNAAFEAVRETFRARDKAFGKVLFSGEDWNRVRIAYDIVKGAPTVADIGIGQGQLVNLLARHPGSQKIYGYDFRKHSKLIEPSGGPYEFRAWNITTPPPFRPEPVDVVVAMEVLEHIPVSELPGSLERLLDLSHRRALLVTVPYQEKEPLFHHDQPTGHQQSFDDGKVEGIFGPNCLYSDYKGRWYFILCHEAIANPSKVDLECFKRTSRGLVSA